MGNKISKVKRSFRKDESYRALSSCSDYESTSNSSVTTSLPNTAPIHSANSAAFPQSILSAQERRTCEGGNAISAADGHTKYRDVLWSDPLLRHSHLQPHQLGTTIKSPVPISRLRLITTTPSPPALPPLAQLHTSDKTNVYKRSGNTERSNDRLPNYQRKPEFTANNPSYHPPNGGYRATEHNIRNSLHLAPVTPVSEQHRWAWRIGDAGTGTGQISERHAHNLLRDVNDRILHQLSRPFHANETYHVEVRVVKMREPMTNSWNGEPSNPRMSYQCDRSGNLCDRLRNQHPFHANPSRSHNHTRQDLTDADLAQLVIHNHERNNIQLNNMRRPSKRISSGYPGTENCAALHSSKTNKRRRKNAPEKQPKCVPYRPSARCYQHDPPSSNFVNAPFRPRKGTFI